MRFNRFLFAILFAFTLGFVGCTQMMPTQPAQQTEQDIPLDQIPVEHRNVDLRVDLAGPHHGFAKGLSMAYGDSSGVVTIVSNAYRTDNGLSTVFQAREWAAGTDIRVSTLNGRSYLALPLINGSPQVGTFTVNGETLHDFVQVDENVGIFARFRIAPDDSLGYRLTQGEDNLDQFTVLHYTIDDPAPADFSIVEVVGTQTAWNNRFAPMTYNATYGIWETWLPAIRGQAVKIAFFGNGQLITTKFIYVDSPDMDERILLDCTEVVANPTTYFAAAPWFTERNQLRGKRVFRIPVDEGGVCTQGCGGIPFTAKISVTNGSIHQSHVIMCATSLYNGGQPFPIPRSGGKWTTPTLNMTTGVFWLSVWDETDGSQFVTKAVKVGTQQLVHLEETESGMAFVGAVFEGPVVVQEEDNLDVEVGGGN